MDGANVAGPLPRLGSLVTCNFFLCNKDLFPSGLFSIGTGVAGIWGGPKNDVLDQNSIVKE